jgi:hypothetical protein
LFPNRCPLRSAMISLGEARSLVWGRGVRRPREGSVGEKLDEDLNLRPPGDGFELYKHKHAESTRTQGWAGLYWARKNESGDYEIRSVAREGEAQSITGGVFPKEGFEEHYEKVSPP